MAFALLGALCGALRLCSDAAAARAFEPNAGGDSSIGSWGKWTLGPWTYVGFYLAIRLAR